MNRSMLLIVTRPQLPRSPSPTGPALFYFLFGEPLDTAGLSHLDRPAVASAYAEVGAW